jgi:hypothetical protein
MVGGVEVWVVLDRVVGGAAVVVAVSALWCCSIDRSPEASDVQRTHGGTRIPQRMASTQPLDPIFGENSSPTVTPDMNQVGGLQCSGVFCPFTAAPIEPCCTTVADVERGAARDVAHCGLDFSATSGDFFQSACWQRDQIGMIDNGCPSVATSPGIEEPGCCSDEGVCGAMNTGNALGCHYALDGARRDCTETEINQQRECNPLGVFGIRSEIDVAWGGRDGGLAALTDDGRGKMVIHLKVTIASIDADNEVHGMIQPCGVELPPFYSTTLCESYRPEFPPAIWESSDLPTIDLSGRYMCRNPGCFLTLDAQTYLLGIDLPNPEAPWPTPGETATLTCANGTAEQCFPDHDKDGLPGLSVTLTTLPGRPVQPCDGNYIERAAPLSASIGAIFGGVRRTDQILLGTRIKLGGAGQLSDDCNSGVGQGVAEFAQSRAWSCIVQEGSANWPEDPAGPNEACDPNEAQFMDDNLPIYNLLQVGQLPDSMLDLDDTSASIGPTFRMTRLGNVDDQTSCATVRGALP